MYSVLSSDAIHYMNFYVQSQNCRVTVADSPGLSTGAKVAIGVGVGISATGAATAAAVSHGGSTAGSAM